MELQLALCHQITTRYTNNTNTHDPSSPQEETIYHGATSRSLSPKHHQVHQQYKHSRPIITPRGDDLPWSYISLSVTKTPLGTPTIQTLTTHHHPNRRRSTMELHLALCHQNTTRYTNNTNTHDPSSPQEETVYHGATSRSLSPKHHQVHQQYKHSRPIITPRGDGIPWSYISLSVTKTPLGTPTIQTLTTHHHPKRRRSTMELHLALCHQNTTRYTNNTNTHDPSSTQEKTIYHGATSRSLSPKHHQVHQQYKHSRPIITPTGDDLPWSYISLSVTKTPLGTPTIQTLTTHHHPKRRRSTMELQLALCHQNTTRYTNNTNTHDPSSPQEETVYHGATSRSLSPKHHQVHQQYKHSRPIITPRGDDLPWSYISLSVTKTPLGTPTIQTLTTHHHPKRRRSTMELHLALCHQNTTRYTNNTNTHDPSSPQEETVYHGATSRSLSPKHHQVHQQYKHSRPIITPRGDDLPWSYISLSVTKTPLGTPTIQTLTTHHHPKRRRSTMEIHLALCHQNTTRYTNNTNTHDPSSPQEETIYHGATSRSLSPKHHQVHQQYKHSRPIITPRGDDLPWSYISLYVTKTPLGTPTIQTLTTHHHPKRRRSTMELQLALCHQNTTRYTNNTNTHDPSSPQEETIYHGATTRSLSPKHHQVHQQYKHSRPIITPRGDDLPWSYISLSVTKTPLGTPTIQTLTTHHHPKRRRSTMELHLALCHQNTTRYTNNTNTHDPSSPQEETIYHGATSRSMSPKHHQVHQQYKHSRPIITPRGDDLPWSYNYHQNTTRYTNNTNTHDPSSPQEETVYHGATSRSMSPKHHQVHQQYKHSRPIITPRGDDLPWSYISLSVTKTPLGTPTIQTLTTHHHPKRRRSTMELHLALCHQNTTRYTNNTNTHDPSSPQEETIYHGATSRSMSPKHHQVHQQYKHSRPIITPRGDDLPWSYISLSVTKTPLGTPTIQTLTTHHHPKRRRSTMELHLALCHQNTTRYTNNTNTHDPSSPQEETIYHGATTRSMSPKHHQVHQQYKHS